MKTKTVLNSNLMIPNFPHNIIITGVRPKDKRGLASKTRPGAANPVILVCGHSESIGQLALKEVYGMVHFVSPGFTWPARRGTIKCMAKKRLLRKYCSIAYTGFAGH